MGKNPRYTNEFKVQALKLLRTSGKGVAQVAKELGIRCRWEKPGLCGRASMLHLSKRDFADAELVGRAGVRGILEGRRGDAVAHDRADDEDWPAPHHLRWPSFRRPVASKARYEPHRLVVNRYSAV